MTVLHESFVKGDSDTLGPDQTWVEEVGDTDIVSNRARVITTGTEASARVNSNLATVNHYVKSNCIMTGGDAANSGVMGMMARKSPDATRTFYYFDADWNNDVTRLMNCVTGTFTQLGTNQPATFTPGVQAELKIECNVDSIKGYVDGNLIHDQTDTTITGNLQFGFRDKNTSGTPTLEHVDFEGGDLAALNIPVSTPVDTLAGEVV